MIVMLVGVGYALVGILFAMPATHVRAWRLAAWIVCAVGFAAHIWYEGARRGRSTRSAARQVAYAVAIGSFGLAVGANIHSLFAGTASQHRVLLLLSLVIWPAITALPAYVVALGTMAVLGRGLGRSTPR